MNKLLRVTGPHTYRLVAVEDDDGLWFGQAAEGHSLRQDIAAYQVGRFKLLYTVFVRPKHWDLAA